MVKLLKWHKGCSSHILEVATPISTGGIPSSVIIGWAKSSFLATSIGQPNQHILYHFDLLFSHITARSEQ
jgi:hypothetical protein